MKNKWSILAFLCGIFFVYTVGRALLGLLAIPIQKETGISDIQFGVLNSAVFWTYAALVPFAGLIGDRFDRRKVIGVAVLAWSAMTVLAGLAGGFLSFLLLVSFAVTAPQTLYGPSANALISSVHTNTRTTALSLHQAAFYTGWLASGAAVAAILASFGTWRAAYFALGALGLLVGAAFLFVGCSTTDKALGSQSNNRESRQAKNSLRVFFGCPSALLAGAGYVLLVFAAFGYGAWGPKFVALKFSLSPGAAGTGVMFWHYAAAFAAILVAGLVTDACVVRWPRFRLALQAATLLLAAPMLVLFGLSSSLASVWTAVALFGVFRGLFEANAFASVFDVVPSDCRASAVGFLNVLAGMLGSIAPILIGWLAQTRGLRGYEIGFAALGGALFVASVLVSVSLFFTFTHDRIREADL